MNLDDRRQRPRATPPRIISIDDDLIVVDKPSGVLSVPGRSASVPVRGRGDTGVQTIQDWIRRDPTLRPDEPLRIVHRLDREASGVMVLARTLNAQRSLIRQFAARRVEKSYLALVNGYVAEPSGAAVHCPAADSASPDSAGFATIDLPLRIDARRQTAVVSHRHGKPAVTRYRVLERLPGNTLLECRPLTGRMHQIRIHLAEIGHPLTVDPLYGGGQALYLSDYKPSYRKRDEHDERPLIARLTLHAASLAFDHPAHGTRVRVEVPLPRDFRATLNQLRRLR
jgi:RluA family pseudouridine synthase